MNDLKVLEELFVLDVILVFIHGESMLQFVYVFGDESKSVVPLLVEGEFLFVQKDMALGDDLTDVG